MGKSKYGLVAPKGAVDPVLDALFSSSSGPVKAPLKLRYAELLPPRPKGKHVSDDEVAEKNDSEDLVDGSDDDDSTGDQKPSEEESTTDEASVTSNVNNDDETADALEALIVQGAGSQDDGRKRKRKHRDEYDNLESNYLNRLADEEEPSGKRQKAEDPAVVSDAEDVTVEDHADSSSDDAALVHESAAADPAAADLEKANRTVFVSNVSAEAVTSRQAKKTLLKHLSSIVDKKVSPPQKIESIRFRSTAFSTAAIPKRAAYIKKSVMEATTKSTNAYVVYSSPSAARMAVTELNGTSVLDRHIRIDSVAHPAAVDHRRCVFVGNLGFVDDESVLNVKVDKEGKEVTEKKKRTKVPMDVEEGLWRVFGKNAGKVESVRVVRDPITRVGKGFAYVQFYDGNDVESAILLNGKKFPPMLPRELRVSRCKAPHKTARAMEAKHGRTATSGEKAKTNKNTTSYVPKSTAEDKTLAGRASKLLGRSAALQLGDGDKWKKRVNPIGGGPRRESTGRITEVGGEKTMKSPEDIVFEGRRASVKDGRPKDLKFKGGGKSKAHGKKRGPNAGGRRTERAAKWKASGGAK